MARLAALVPVPYLNMTRYHGVFASRSKWRSRLPAPAERRAAGERLGAAIPSSSGDAVSSVPSSAPAPGGAASGGVTSDPRVDDGHADAGGAVSSLELVLLLGCYSQFAVERSADSEEISETAVGALIETPREADPGWTERTSPSHVIFESAPVMIPSL